MQTSNSGRKRSARRVRVAAAIALLGLAGCADQALPAKAAVGQPAPAFTFELAALGQADTGDAKLLAELMRQEMARRNLTSGAARQAFRVGGVVDAAQGPKGLYLVAVLDINDASGQRLHRIVDDQQRPDTPAVTYADLQRLAARSVAKIADWYDTSHPASGKPADIEAEAVPSAGIDETLSTGSIAASALPGAPALSFDITMGPAPGDGGDALKAALTDELHDGAAGKTPAAGRFLVRGEVAISTVGNGDMDVEIQWQVKTPDDRLLGTVTQTQAVGPSRIAGYWGDLARDAAEPAARGILALIAPPPRLPGNAS